MISDTEQLVLKYLSEQTAPVGIKALNKALKLRPAQGRDAIAALEETGQVLKTSRNLYALPQKLGLVQGRVLLRAKGAIFIPDAGGDEFSIPKTKLHGALNRDRVWATQPKGGVCSVKLITARATRRVAGTYKKGGRGSLAQVLPADPRQDTVDIPKGQSGGAMHDDIVLVEITRYPQGPENMQGRVVDVLGKAGDSGLQYTAIVRQAGFNEDFPDAAEELAKSVAQPVSQAAIARREDWRDVVTITIDGADAKDLDDAVSIREISDGCYELAVHIADVSHYVQSGSELDTQAYERATSVYFANRVWPMLPRTLSNGICSLNPGVDRLALSCIMEVDRKGAISKYRVAETVIHSDARMTYHDVTRILAGDAELCARYAKLVPEFMRMQTLTHALIQMRKNRGALDFDVPEAKAIIGADGKAENIYRVQRGFAEQIIESFMLLANETVAEYIENLGVTGMYRVHEEPEAEALDRLRVTANMLGFKFRAGKGRGANRAMQYLLQESQGTAAQPVLNKLSLRTMQKARYAADNLQHFGLAADYYTHFTSPIRRYPDLVVHRVLKRALRGDIAAQSDVSQARMEQMARHCSERERAAEEAERSVMDVMGCEVMRRNIGEEYDGIISGVTKFGFFVMLPNTVEGLVHIATLPGYYEYDEKQLCLRPSRGNRIFRLGADVRVRVDAVDEGQRRIDFGLVAREKKPL